MKENNIRTKENSHCPVCKNIGILLYSNLTDKILNNPGVWNIKRCGDTECGAMFLDPTPIEEDIYKLYINYPTHELELTNISISKKDTYTSRVRDSIWRKKLGYGSNFKTSTLEYFGYLLSFLHPGWRDAQLSHLFYVPYVNDGKILDVGCGNGSSLLSLAKHGWHTFGVDFDHEAIEVARKRGIEAHVGTVADQNYPANTFDAVLLSHVVEHLPDPVSTLKECYRILKKDGTLIALTPNATSLGHFIYKENWRGLEHPDHLHIYTRKSLGKTLLSSGFKQIAVKGSVQGLQYIREASSYIKKYGSESNLVAKNNLMRQAVFFIYGWVHLLKPDSDEVIVAVAKK